MSILDPHPHSRFSPKLAFGFVLILAGGLILLERMNLLDWHHLAWWPTLFFILGLAALWKRGFTRSFWGHALLVLGAVGLAGEFGREDLVERWWPVGVIWIGLVVVIRALQRPARPCCPEAVPVASPGPVIETETSSAPDIEAGRPL